MKKTVLLCFATLFAGVISLAGYDLSQESNRKTPDLRLVGDPVKIDRLGVWNVWPNYAGIEFLHQKLTGEPVEFIFNFSPADTSIAWLDGHLFSLNDAQGNEVLRIDMVRRGRFRLHWAGKKALSRYQDWRCTVINWDNLTPRDLTVKIADGSAALIGDGKTILKLDGGKLEPGDYTVALGRKANEKERGALGWFRSYEMRPASDGAFPPPQPLPGKPEWAARVDALEKFFITPEMDAIECNPELIRYYDARTAAAYIALDGLWYRLSYNLEPGFEFFLTELEKLAEEVKSGSVADYTIDVSRPDGTPAPEYFLAPADTDFYYGDCGWGLAAYAPEMARIGINLVSEHIWPDALLDKDGNPHDCMLIRRTMPQLEEFEKYNIALDVMIAPYTPGYLLKKHPEWDGVFFGYGAENETEKLRQHAAQWQGRQAGHGFLKASIISPDYVEMCRTFLEYLLPRIRDSKAVVAIDLANEVQFEDYSPLMQERFRAFLREKYGSIENLNRAWNSEYASFDDILMVRPMVFSRKNAARFWDWVLCNREVGTEHLAYLHQLCRENAPGIPTHIKHLPYEFGMPWYDPESDGANFYDYADGIDRKALAQLTEIIGTDSWADNGHDATGRLSSDVTSYQQPYLNLLRSYAPDKWIFDSEWHIIRCDPPATVPACLDMVMQQNAVQGLKAGTFWLCCPGNGQNLELSSTVSLMLQSGLTTAKIRSQRELFTALANRPKRFGVLYSPKSRYVAGPMHVTLLLAYMQSAAFSGVEPRLIDERQLINGEVTAADLDVLVVIECPYPMDETSEALRKFSVDGGKLILYGKYGTRLDPAIERPTFLRSGRFETDYLRRLEQIQRDAAEFGCAPAYRVTAEDGSPVWGIEYHCAELPDGGRVLYVANMSKETRNLKITRQDGSPVRELVLPNWGTELIVEK